MRVLLSTASASRQAAHGGPVVAWRQARALARAGAEVVVAAPGATATSQPGPVAVHTYRPSLPKPLHFPHQRPNAIATASLGLLIDEVQPDIVYDVHGPAWAVDAAASRHVPVVSMVGDYAWYCRRTFLVDPQLHRCSGPDSMAKCFDCVNLHYSPPRRAVHVALKTAARHGVPLNRAMSGRLASLRLWDAVQESEAYISRVRGNVDCFVIGDAQAHAFFREHGVAEDRIVRLAQCLPSEALVRQRSTRDTLRAGERPLRIAFVGRPAVDKGIHVLCRAFEEMPRAPAELWIVHADQATQEDIAPYFSDRSAFGSMLETGRVKLFRPRSSEEVFRLMADADLGVVPSIAFESPSLALLEFVAQGTPVVRSESLGMEHVIQDGVNGRTFPYGDWKALRDLLAAICADPAVLDGWRRALPQIGADDTYAAELMAIFRRVAVGRSKSLEGAHS